MKKRILIAYASFGSGHKTSAEYIYDYFKEHTDYELKIVDVMDYASSVGKLSVSIFNLNFKHQYSLINTIGYEMSDNRIVTSPYKKITNICVKKQIQEDFLEYNPDILIATHFFGGIIMGQIKNKYNLNTKIITVITDYKSNCMWTQNHKNENYFIVSNDIVKQDLLKFKIPEEKICPFGIPLSSKFKNVETNTKKVKYKYNIKNDKPIVLFFGGGSMGSLFSYKYFKTLLNLELNINIIFVSGKNVELYNKCNKLIKKENIKNVTILGFTNDVTNLLNIATLVVTKPGGLSVTEALEIKTPMVLIPGNGGQEIHNARFVTKNKFGIRTYNTSNFAKNMKKLIENPYLIKNMYNKLKYYEENKSVEKLFNLVQKELQ